MAIRFSCPSCRQPIEVDDNWAGQTVACPYCRRVVTAPAQSSWPPPVIPVAAPATGGIAPPPPPGIPAGQPVTGTFPARRSAGPSVAGWALTLAILAALLAVIGSLMWYGGIVQVALQRTGPDPSVPELQRTLQEIVLSGSVPTSRAVTTTLFAGTICGLIALVLAIRSLIGGEGHTGKAVVACVISSLFVACQCVLTMAIFQQRMH
jgi:hypothetical protein